MFSKRQLIVFVVSFSIAGFFLLSRPEVGFSGANGVSCCQETSTSCYTCIGAQLCPACPVPFVEGVACNESTGRCVEPIPTLNQWGKIITIAVIGLFAVIGIFAMRRRGTLKSH